MAAIVSQNPFVSLQQAAIQIATSFLELLPFSHIACVTGYVTFDSTIKQREGLYAL